MAKAVRNKSIDIYERTCRIFEKRDRKDDLHSMLGLCEGAEVMLVSVISIVISSSTRFMNASAVLMLGCFAASRLQVENSGCKSYKRAM